MEWNFRPLATALMGYAVILGSVLAIWAFFGRGRRRRWLFVAIPVVFWALFAGVPFLLPPILDLRPVAGVAGVLCVVAGAAFTTIAIRARRALRSAESRKATAASDAMSGLDRGDGAEVTLQGLIEGDPPLVAPVSGVPCLSYRVELFRQDAGGEELIALEEAACDRMVLTDASGRVALSADARGLRAAGAPAAETVATGALGSEKDDPRLQRAARHLSPTGLTPGATYRAVERAVQHGAPMTAVGRMVRRAGEPVLVPTLAARVSLRFGGDAMQGYRRLMFGSAVLAALSVGAGFALISAPHEAPVKVEEP
jgi:hypothetical protein